MLTTKRSLRTSCRAFVHVARRSFADGIWILKRTFLPAYTVSCMALFRTHRHRMYTKATEFASHIVGRNATVATAKPQSEGDVDWTAYDKLLTEAPVFNAIAHWVVARCAQLTGKLSPAE